MLTLISNSFPKLLKHEIQLQNLMNYKCMYDTFSNFNIDDMNHAQNYVIQQNHACVYELTSTSSF